MRTMTATDASRSFASLLDAVEDGETVVVTRGGKRVATIAPASSGNGGAVADLLSNARVDSGFERDVRVAVEYLADEAPEWPDD